MNMLLISTICFALAFVLGYAEDELKNARRNAIPTAQSKFLRITELYCCIGSVITASFGIGTVFLWGIGL